MPINNAEFSGEHPEQDPPVVGYGGALHAAGQRTHPGPAVPLRSSTLAAEMLASATWNPSGKHPDSLSAGIHLSDNFYQFQLHCGYETTEVAEQAVSLAKE